VPLAVDIHKALAAGMLSIEHLTGYDRALSRAGHSGTFGWTDVDTARLAGLVSASVTAGVWNCPTMTIYAELARRQHSPAEQTAISQSRRLFVKRLSDAGALLLAGTDAGIDVVPPGTSLHDELAELVAAGLSPYLALRSATSEAARFLGRADLGTVAIGAEASLLLLRANPLDNIGALRHADGMVLRGAWRPAGNP
jgi:imidazolonepropionase-like amidohydrolase